MTTPTPYTYRQFDGKIISKTITSGTIVVSCASRAIYVAKESNSVFFVYYGLQAKLCDSWQTAMSEFTICMDHSIQCDHDDEIDCPDYRS